MKSKKLLSLALALAMVLALAIPAFASNSVVSGGQMTTTLSGKYQAYTLKLTVKDGSNVLVNPYKIKFTPPGKDNAIDNQVVNTGTFITNSTDVKLKVSAKITATLGGDVKLLGAASDVNKANNDGTMDKGAFMVFEIATARDNETEPTWTAPEAVTSSTPTAKALPVTCNVADTNHEALVFTDCLKLAAVEQGGDPNYACFHVDGLLNVYPLSASTTSGGDPVDNPWTDNDTISVSVILTFTPDVVVATYSGASGG